jgi:hypothetical protein
MNLFLNLELVDIGDNSVLTPVNQDAITFDAIGYLVTRSLGSAGWDGENLCFVFSVDFPMELCSLFLYSGKRMCRSLAWCWSQNQ